MACEKRALSNRSMLQQQRRNRTILMIMLSSMAISATNIRIRSLRNASFLRFGLPFVSSFSPTKVFERHLHHQRSSSANPFRHPLITSFYANTSQLFQSSSNNNEDKIPSIADQVSLFSTSPFQDDSRGLIPSSSPLQTPQLRSISTEPSSPTPWLVPKSIDIPQEDLDIRFVRSSGAGGQNVNKVNTKVELRLDVANAGSWIPQEVKERLLTQHSNRINKDGILVLYSQEYRTQAQNKKDALDKLSALVLEAWPRPKVRKQRKGISKASKERNKELKRKRSQVKQNRKRVSDW